MLDYIYSLGIRWRNKQFDADTFASYKSSLPVISIGNISTGGTGKSPFVQHLTRHFLQEGKKIAIIGRGYRRSTKGFLLVSDGKTLYENAKTAGDELFMHASALPSAIIIADEKRSRAAQWIEKNTQCDIILLDDGFQHRHIKRDVDIVLIDTQTLTTRLLPFGHLREPLTSLQRASVLCFADSVTQDMKNTLFDNISHLPKEIYTYSTKIRKIRRAWHSNDDFPQVKICEVLTSIAHPERFHQLLHKSGWILTNIYSYPDHYYFTEQDIIRICKSNNTSEKSIYITTKDEGKLSYFKHIFEQYSVECYVVEIETYIENQEQFNSFVNLSISKRL